MKQIKTTVALILALLCVLITSFSVLASPVLLGDANGDNNVNILDLVHVKKHVANNENQLNGFNAVDTNCDGTINAVDLTNLISILLSDTNSEIALIVDEID